MRILLLGDVCGPAGMQIIKLQLKKIIKDKKIDFTIANGENAAENGKGITKNNFVELIKSGVDVVTSGNHIWDQKETTDYINKENRLLRPANFPEDSPAFEVAFPILLPRDFAKPAAKGIIIIAKLASFQF